jgi:hypothetical protein
MRAYIDEGPWDTLDGEPVAAVQAEDGTTYGVPVEPKQYYIEFPPEDDYIVKKVSVDVYGLDNEEVIRLLTALNEAGFEADIFVNKPYITMPNKYWYESPSLPNQPLITYTNLNTSQKYADHFEKEVPGQMGIHEYLDED